MSVLASVLHGTWYCTAEETKLHLSPSSSSLALFQIDSPILWFPFSLQHLQTGGNNSILSTHVSCKLLSSLEMSSLHKAPCCAAPWSGYVCSRAVLPWDREQGLLAMAGHCWGLDTALWSCMCWAMWKTTILSNLCKGICLGQLTATAAVFNLWKLLQHKSMFEAVELNVS